MTIIVIAQPPSLAAASLFNPHNLKCVQIIIRLISTHHGVEGLPFSTYRQIRIGIECLKRTPAPRVTQIAAADTASPSGPLSKIRKL